LRLLLLERRPLMKQNRNEDREVPNRQSHTEKAGGSRDKGSVLDDRESFEHGSGESDVTRGMGSSGERGTGSTRERGRSST
jgi:hypothetical protein